VGDVCAAIPQGRRFLGLTVGIISASTGKISDYWWEQGLADDKLVLKASGRSGPSSYAYGGDPSSFTSDDLAEGTANGETYLWGGTPSSFSTSNLEEEPA
jgi:hypothetical protein